MTSAKRNLVRKFADDDRGAIAIIFGLSFTVFLLVAGVAIDLGRAIHTDQRLTAALDAAALSAGRSLIDGQLSDDEIRQKAIAVLNQNFDAGGRGFGTLSGVDLAFDRATGAVTINTTATVPTTITRIARVNQFTMPRDASVIYDQKDIELGMQLDVTGSMRGQKLNDLKTATKDLIDILLPDGGTPNKVRIGLAPYASGINVGAATASLVTNNRNAGTSCVYDRVGTDAATDAAPAAGSYFKGKADLPSAENCPASAQLVPISDDKALLKTRVDGYRDGGTTAGQIGSQWAWNLISPKWSGIWPAASRPAPYRDGKTLKAVILMTDGEYNTFEGRCDNAGCNPYGARGTQSNNRARALCASMKADGVEVYTVGFMLNHPVALETLGQCATSPSHFFTAASGEQLRDSFVSIARRLTNLRLTQ